jgi:signal peptidase I
VPALTTTRRVLLGSLVAALVLAVAAVAVVAVISVRVDGTSMSPALHDGDRVVVNPFARQPRRLDVVVLRFADGRPEVVKRVAGLGGDRVVVTGQAVFVQPGAAGPWQRVDGAPWSRFVAPADLVVPADALFVLGDSPDASQDSRQLGPIPRRLVRGTVTLRVYPLGTVGHPGATITLTPADPPPQPR